MLKVTVALLGLGLLSLPMSVRAADEDRSSAEAERVETAPINLFPLPGPVYDESGRLIAAPPPSDLRDARDILLRLPALPEAAPRAGAGPPRTRPPRRGEP